MNLEDHLGDIIRKARAMSNVSAEAAAKAAGVSEAELAALEESGTFPKRPGFATLAGLIGLNAAKLEGIADGWLPPEQDLSGWHELRVFTTAGDGITVNCYLVWDEVTLDAALFDTGFDAQPILDCIAGISYSSGTFSSRTRITTIWRWWGRSGRRGRRCGCTAVPRARRWISATSLRKSSTSAGCA